jgi:hypothetical protein
MLLPWKGLVQQMANSFIAEVKLLLLAGSMYIGPGNMGAAMLVFPTAQKHIVAEKTGEHNPNWLASPPYRLQQIIDEHM